MAEIELKGHSHINEIYQSIDRFLQKPSGFFTLNFSGVEKIEGLDLIIESAASLCGKSGNLELIEVSKSMYTDLMNTQKNGKRLISLADIYTDRTEMELAIFFDELVNNCREFGIKPEELKEIAKDSRGWYENLHGNLAENIWLMEYGIVRCVRFIETKHPKNISHLGYTFGDTENMLNASATTVNILEESAIAQLKTSQIYTGQCLTWKEERGFGFIHEDTTHLSVFVHRSDCPWRKESYGYGLTPGDKYTYTREKTEKGFQGKNIGKIGY